MTVVSRGAVMVTVGNSTGLVIVPGRLKSEGKLTLLLRRLSKNACSPAFNSPECRPNCKAAIIGLPMRAAVSNTAATLVPNLPNVASSACSIVGLYTGSLAAFTTKRNNGALALANADS